MSRNCGFHYRCPFIEKCGSVGRFHTLTLYMESIGHILSGSELKDDTFSGKMLMLYVERSETKRVVWEWLITRSMGLDGKRSRSSHSNSFMYPIYPENLLQTIVNRCLFRLWTRMWMQECWNTMLTCTS